METNVASEDFENKVKALTKEIESLSSEIIDLKNDIKNKEIELHKSFLKRFGGNGFHYIDTFRLKIPFKVLVETFIINFDTEFYHIS